MRLARSGTGSAGPENPAVVGRNIDRMTDLTALPTEALCFALGSVTARAAAAQPGRVVALVDELNRRGAYDRLSAALSPEMASALAVTYMADRGQSWARSGQTRRQPANS